VTSPDDAQLAVNVIGFLDDALGLAQAARLYVAALRAANVPVATMAVTPDDAAASAADTITRYGNRRHEHLRTPFEPRFNLACLNGEHLTKLARARDGDVLARRSTIGQWAWETDVLPPSWFPAFRYLEEIWVFSSFVAENLGRLSPVPVVVIPMAVTLPDRSGIELSIARDDRFTFLFIFDFLSTVRRKNTFGLLDAFTRAFAPGEGPRLLLKAINGRLRPEVDAELRRRIDEHPDIDLIDMYLEPVQNAALLARADCYVSLHRSEGFGLTLAESMALGTPVIATGYSGNTDFTTPQNSYLVDWTPTHVGPGCEIYPAEGVWAEPDLDHAAEQMRRVWQRPEEARVKAKRAQLDIHRLYAPEVVGRLARVRLERLYATLDRRRRGGLPHRAPPRGAAVTDARLDVVEAELGFDLKGGAAPTPSGIRGTFRRLVMRLMLPFTVHERKLDRALADAMHALQAEVARERALRVEDHKRIEHLEERLRAQGDPGRRR
jgi:glycosyltransferase involved in cell wall biosynthesis